MRTETTCQTDQNGPVIFTPCAQQCTNEAPPQNELCPKFFAKGTEQENVAQYKIGEIICYKPKLEEKAGWCYTANEKAIDQWGYCMKTCNEQELKVSDKLHFVVLESFKETNCHEG